MNLVQELKNFLTFNKHPDWWLDWTSRAMLVISIIGSSLMLSCLLFSAPLGFLFWGVFLVSIPSVWRSFLGYLTWRVE